MFMPRRIFSRNAMLKTIFLVTVLATWSATATAAADWADVEGRLQYAYYIEDGRALTSIAQTVAASPADAMRDYYLGLAQYRALLLAIGRNKDAAKVAAEACVDRLEGATKARVGFADALALQAGCMGILSGLKPWKAIVLGSRSTSQLEASVKSAPRNPRVILLDALADYERPAIVGGDKQRAFAKFQKAVEAFEVERQGVSPVPGWGAAEAYAYLARSQLDRGDAVAARGSLERALLLAPDFAFAKRLLAKIT